MAPLYKKRDPIQCLICKHKISRCDNLKRHITSKHQLFLSQRVQQFQVSKEKALKDTITNHIYDGKLPEELSSLFERTLITYYIPKESQGQNLKADDVGTTLKVHDENNNASKVSAEVNPVRVLVLSEDASSAIDTERNGSLPSAVKHAGSQYVNEPPK